MIILPIKSITEVDQVIFGANLVNLAKLARVGLPVLPGFAVSPPEIILQAVLKHFQSAEREVFEERLTILKKDLGSILEPAELTKELGKKKQFWLAGRVRKRKEIWPTLLEMWLEEIRKKLWTEGFSENLTRSLSAQAVFEIHDQNPLEVVAHFNPDLCKVIIAYPQKIDSEVLQEIDEIINVANKKLFLPQVYRFVLLSKKPYLVGLKPFTQTLPATKNEEITLPKVAERKLVRSAVKLFLNLSQGFVIEPSSDGVLIEGEKVDSYDDLVFRLVEAAFTFPTKPIIFKLPNKNNDSDIKGVLRLIYQKDLLEQAAMAFLFVRNKKGLLNLELAIPKTRSAEEFLQIKRELAARNITRKGTLKFWLEMAVPENLVNLEDYLETGLDGIILDLDELQRHIGGYEFSEGEYYKHQIQAVVKLIQPAFKTLHKAKVLILAKGVLSIHPDVLECLLENGVFGVVANTPLEAESLPDHLSWVEKRMVARRIK